MMIIIMIMIICCGRSCKVFQPNQVSCGAVGSKRSKYQNVTLEMFIYEGSVEVLKMASLDSS
jgi:hypothetical protein